MHHSVVLSRIPAHSGFSGNEKADILAKREAKTPFLGPQPVIPITNRLLTLSFCVVFKRNTTQCGGVYHTVNKQRRLHSP
jgi:hypothetical protein